MTADVVRDFNSLAQEIDNKVMPKDIETLSVSQISVSDGVRSLNLGSVANEIRFGTSTNHDISLITKSLERGRITAAGSLVWQDRILTGRAGMQIGQDASAAKNFHFVSDDVGARTAFRVYNGVYGSGIRMLGIDTAGNVTIGAQGDALNDEGWSKVVDIYKTGNLNLTIRTDTSRGVIAVHDSGFYGSSAGMILGTVTNQELSFVVNKIRRAVIGTDGSFTVTTGALGVSTSQDAMTTLSAGNIPGNGWRIKQIINSYNDGYGGAGLIFRAIRPTDGAFMDIKINYQKGGGDVMTESHVVKSTSAPSGGFDGQIWLQYT